MSKMKTMQKESGLWEWEVQLAQHTPAARTERQARGDNTRDRGLTDQPTTQSLALLYLHRNDQQSLCVFYLQCKLLQLGKQFAIIRAYIHPCLLEKTGEYVVLQDSSKTFMNFLNKPIQYNPLKSYNNCTFNKTKELKFKVQLCIRKNGN